MSGCNDSITVLGLVALLAVPSCTPDKPAKARVQSRSEATVNDVDVIPGKAIGAIRLGLKTTELPLQCVLEQGVAGEYQGIHFLLDRGVVSEVWIEDLRTFPKPVRFQGEVLAQDLSVDELKQRLGPCKPVQGVIGGARYLCTHGLVLGLDSEERGDFVQIRVRS